MWTPLDLPIEVSRNGVTGIGLEVWDDVASEALDLTGLTFTCKVARALGEPQITAFAVEIVDAVSGEIDIEFDGRIISVQGEKEIVRLVYEVKSSLGDTLLRGPLYLIPGI